MNIVIQAGGRGSRLRHYTWNKPKCLVPYKGKPIIYHLFKKFPSCNFHIIADYKFELIETFLKLNNPNVNYTLHRSTHVGSSAGLSDTISELNDSPILLMWSDLFFDELDLTNISDNTIFTTDSFTCRYKLLNDTIIKENTHTDGIPGVFYFTNKNQIKNVSNEGEFLDWIISNDIKFKSIKLNNIKELGEFNVIKDEYDKPTHCRFFNNVDIQDDVVIKTCIVDEYSHLIENEIKWYKLVNTHFKNIPTIISESPLILNRIKGKHLHSIKTADDSVKVEIIKNYVDSLNKLHNFKTSNTIHTDIIDVYKNKTIDRVNSVSELIPYIDKDTITINGVKCSNIFKDIDGFFNKYIDILTPDKFHILHGDPTFSNTLVTDDNIVWFIDPRGYFNTGNPFGDRYYDFSKLYYSAVGNYDSFNSKQFKLHLDDTCVEILMEPSSFKSTLDNIYSSTFTKDELFKIKLIHGLIWLSYTGYTKEDIDSIIGSFCLGLYYIQTTLNEIHT